MTADPITRDVLPRQWRETAPSHVELSFAQSNADAFQRKMVHGKGWGGKVALPDPLEWTCATAPGIAVR
jgi:hypothetical protein